MRPWRRATRFHNVLIWSAVTCHRFGRAVPAPLFGSESVNERKDQSADRSAHSKFAAF